LSAIDPIRQPDEYQQLLLSYVGDRDPAQIQAELGGALEALVDETGPDLRTRPAEGEWSVLELVGHILDAEVVYAGRYRWTLAQDRPVLIGYDQDRWVEALDHNAGDPAEMLALFRALRRSHLALWAESTSERRARVAMHEERGPESFDLSFRLIAGHGLLHLDQMRATLDAVGRR
jgi:uncharacterized damage-inducible protein DinB